MNKTETLDWFQTESINKNPAAESKISRVDGHQTFIFTARFFQRGYIKATSNT
jgi:hypothetical protein